MPALRRSRINASPHVCKRIPGCVRYATERQRWRAYVRFLTLPVEVTDCRPNNEPKDPCRIVLSLRKANSIEAGKGQCALQKSPPPLKAYRQNCTAGLSAWSPG